MLVEVIPYKNFKEKNKNSKRAAKEKYVYRDLGEYDLCE